MGHESGIVECVTIHFTARHGFFGKQTWPFGERQVSWHWAIIQLSSAGIDDRSSHLVSCQLPSPVMQLSQDLLAPMKIRKFHTRN
uniref:Uncharacterized protein n=1 Tax=Strigamia maritima TaxID=126957 RepID=T1JMN5_STRMM